LRAGAVHNLDPTGLLFGQLQKSFANPLVKVHRFHVQPIDVALRPPPS
jgi:hypothetical protein